VRKKRGTKKPPSVQSIIRAIIDKDEQPPSPRMSNTRAVEKALGITSQQEAAIAAQASPRLRAKAVGSALLALRPLSSCAGTMRMQRGNRGFRMMQPRQGF